MKKRDFIYYILAFLGIMPFTSCIQENANNTDLSAGYPIVVKADIAGKNDFETRAKRTEIGDQWSYTDFEEGDKMGFYSSGGNFSNGNDGSAPFDNQELVYEDKQFVDPQLGAIFSPTNMKSSEIFMYFPYDKNINDSGMELRIKAEEDNDTLRCIDFLSSSSLNILGIQNGQDMALYGTFKHAFSELIIMRGEGFEAPPNDKWAINVVLSNPITHIQVSVSTDGEKWSCTPIFRYDGTGLSEDEARRWTAWRGYNYGITENNDPIGTPAWYVIVPSLSNNYSTVDYVELYDNEGYLQRVSSLQFDANTKKVKPGWRYPIEIIMKELVPTVNPFPIMPWENEKNLTDERKRGINDISEFANWVRDYNAYLLSPKDTEKQDALLKYGDKYVDAGGNLSWHFYVLSDLDFSNYSPLPNENENGETVEPRTDVIIPTLQDVLDGKSSKLSNGKFVNYKILGLDKTFVGEMKPNASSINPGSVQNFDFVNPTIDNENNAAPAGIVVNSMTDGSIINCNIINGSLLNRGGPAGMLVGSLNGGTLRDCVLSGFLIGSGTHEKIVGTEPEGVFSIENVDAADVAFEKWRFYAFDIWEILK